MSQAAVATPPAEKMLSRKEGNIGYVIFNNPERHNAVSLDMWAMAGQMLDDFRHDNNIKVVVVTGAGGKAFVSGADISQFEKNRNNAAASEEYNRRSGAPQAILAGYTKPTIACIQGFCIGGGMALAMACDMRIAAHGSQFGIPAAKLGIAYGYGGLKNLTSLVGPSRARLLMFTGMRIDAEEADKIGLIDRLVPETSLWEATMDIARQIAVNAPLAVYAAKLTIAEILKDPGKRDMEAIKKIGDTCMDSEDFKEGRTAFMEKRKPVFKGR
jgi:enoyl-CoA hydratase/carnithine racemase